MKRKSFQLSSTSEFSMKEPIDSDNQITERSPTLPTKPPIIDSDPVLVKFFCFFYCSMVLLTSVIMDSNRFVALSDVFKKKYAVLHSRFTVGLLIFNTILLLLQQISNPPSNNAPIRRYKLIRKHLRVLLIVVTICSAFLYILGAVKHGLWYYECKDEIYGVIVAKNGTDFENMIILKDGKNASDLIKEEHEEEEEHHVDKSRERFVQNMLFRSATVVFIVVQGIYYWVNKVLKQLILILAISILRNSALIQRRKKVSVISLIIMCQTAATNCALYFGITVMEAAEAFELIERKGERLMSKCGEETKDDMLSKFLYISTYYIEPLGYATIIECLITFTLIIVIIAYELFFVEEDHHFDATEIIREKQTVRLHQIPTLELAIKSLRERKQRESRLPIWVAFSHCSAVILFITCSGAIGVYGVYFVRDLISKDINVSFDFNHMLLTRAGASIAVGLFCLLALINQNSHRSNENHSAHIQLDIYLLYGTVLGAFVYLMYIINSAINTQKYVGYWLQIWQLLDAFSRFAQIVIQVPFLQRALVYDTGRSLTYNVAVSGAINTDDRFRIDWLVELLCTIILTIFNLMEWFFTLFLRKYTLQFDPTAHFYYPDLFWIFMSEATYPLMIFFRFHCFVIALTSISGEAGHYWGYKAARAQGLTWRSIVLPLRDETRVHSMDIFGV